MILVSAQETAALFAMHRGITGQSLGEVIVQAVEGYTRGCRVWLALAIANLGAMFALFAMRRLLPAGHPVRVWTEGMVREWRAPLGLSQSRRSSSA